MSWVQILPREPLHRKESCGGHFREEYATKEGEAKRDDKNFTYVIWCPETKLSAIIDPSTEINPIIEYFEKNNLILSKILITHTHHDHINYLSDFIYIHGHPDGITDSGENFYNDKMCIMVEQVVAEQMDEGIQFKYGESTTNAMFESNYTVISDAVYGIHFASLGDNITINIKIQTKKI